MIQNTPFDLVKAAAARERPCPHRSVSKDGRVVCAKIHQGDDSLSPNLCQRCPFRTIDCAHLRFSLRLSSPSPLVVRFNGRTEIWDDDPPRLSFAQAACAALALPIEQCHGCSTCPLREAVQCEGVDAFLGSVVAQHSSSQRAFNTAKRGKVVPFRQHGALAATG